MMPTRTVIDDFLDGLRDVATQFATDFVQDRIGAPAPQPQHARRVNGKPPKAPKVPKQPKVKFSTRIKPTATHYDTLQVAWTADDETISAAYRSLCKRAHPDNWPHNTPLRQSGEARMKKYTEAYAALKDPVKRKEYDRSIR